MHSAGITKSAMLLLSLGESAAAAVLKYLDPAEVHKICSAMASMNSLSRQQVSNVLDEFTQLAAQKTSFGLDSGDYIRSMLIKALGDDRATGLLDRIQTNSNTGSGIDSLKWMEPVAIAELIGNEHPQIIATILVHLEPDAAAIILKSLTEHIRSDVLLRIATLDSVQSDALRELNEVLSTLLTGNALNKKRLKGGARAAAKILNFFGQPEEEVVIASLRSHDPDLAQKIIDQLFVFENLLDMDSRGIQLVLREIRSESLIVALKGASEELCDKIFKNMSQRAGGLLREDMEAKGPVRVSEIDAAQQEILKVVRRLSDEGQLALDGKSGDSHQYEQ